MKKTILSLLALVSLATLSAQIIKIPAGKKFAVTAETKMETSATVMGNQMDMENTIVTFLDYEVKSVSANNYQVSMILRRTKTTMNIAGQDQSFDTDDEAVKNNPQLAELASTLNKPIDVEISKKGVSIKNDLSSKLAQMGIPANYNDQSKFILLQEELLSMAPGKKWSDSTSEDSNSWVNEYTISQSDASTIEMLVKTNTKIKTTMNQMGMDIHQSLQGTVNAKRLYNKASGLLIKEESDMAISGTMEVMGQNAPLTIKGKITTTVNQNN